MAEGTFAPGYGAPQPPVASSSYAQYPPQQDGDQPSPQGAPRKGRGWIVALVLALILLALVGSVAACSASIASIASSDNTFQGNTVAVITMGGTIDYDGTENSPEGFKYLLDKASEDDNIKAVVLRVNSGGGVAAAGEEMATYLQGFDKPVVVSSAAINASAAYMISSQADWIFVLNSTDIGSIGTILQHYDLSELLAKLGISIENIKSAEGKDSSYYNRPLTDEERASYQHLVDQINENFIKMVAEGREMGIDEVRALADGMSMVGQDSIDAGLADELGTLDDACEKAAELAGCKDDYNVDDLAISSNDLAHLMDLLGSSQGGRNDMVNMIEELVAHDGTVQ